MTAPLDYRHTMQFSTPDGVLEVEVRELTVAQIRALMMGETVEKTEPPTALDVALWGMDPLASTVDILPADIPRFTDLSASDAEQLTLRQRQALTDKIREVNRDFFALVGRWPDVVAELAARMTLPPGLTDSSVPSPA